MLADPARRHPAVDALAIAALAFALRFGIVLFSNGGPGGLFGYDAGVYYSAADALTYGRVPYHDFILLHPPGLMLVLTPFAWLGRLTTDHAGYITANVFFNALAAASAVLVWRIATLWGLTRRAALIGGLFYAVWWGGVNAEIGLRLEPLGTFLFLAGFYLLTRGRAVPAGLLLGATCCVKIWWTLPVLVVLVWLLARREQRPAGWRALAGAAAAAVAINGPFLVLAGREMWQRVVADQLGRKYSTSPTVRIQQLAGLRKAFPGLSTPLLTVVVVVIGAVFVLAIAVAWRHVVARLAVAVLVAQFLMLMVSPSFFTFYGGFLAGPLALTVAAASEPTETQPTETHPAENEPTEPTTRRRRRLDHRTGLLTTALAVLVTLAALGHSRNVVSPFPGKKFERASAGLHCVMVDSNAALILMNRLSDQLAHGCPNWVDVTGHTYFGAAKAHDVRRSRNAAWQRLLRGYLFSGDGLLIVRPNGTQPSYYTQTLIKRNVPIARGDGYVLYRLTR